MVQCRFTTSRSKKGSISGGVEGKKRMQLKKPESFTQIGEVGSGGLASL